MCGGAHGVRRARRGQGGRRDAVASTWGKRGERGGGKGLRKVRTVGVDVAGEIHFIRQGSALGDILDDRHGRGHRRRGCQ